MIKQTAKGPTGDTGPTGATGDAKPQVKPPVKFGVGNMKATDQTEAQRGTSAPYKRAVD